MERRTGVLVAMPVLRARWPRALSSLALALGFVLALWADVPALAATDPAIHAHRGGSAPLGVPRHPENTMPAFRNAAANGWVLELDVKLSEDRKPVVIHDDTLDRTTVCTGPVNARPRAELISDCPTDRLGTDGPDLPPMEETDRRVPLPTLEEVLAFARRRGAVINLEIKNLPTDNDFDPTPAYATTIASVIKASGFPQERLILQNFWPPNLEVARSLLPRAELSLLTLHQMNEGGPAFAAANRYHWVSPAWPVSSTYVDEAHALGLRVVPYTINTASGARAADDAGVDAVISDTPGIAEAAVR